MEKEIKIQIGNRIKELRESKALNRPQFAAKLGVSQDKIKHIESGRDDIPIEMLLKIKEVYKLSIEYILTGEEPKEVNLKAIADLKKYYNLTDEQLNVIEFVLKK